MFDLYKSYFDLSKILFHNSCTFVVQVKQVFSFNTFFQCPI